MQNNDKKYSHLFSINWCKMQDFPAPALPITKNLKRKSEEYNKMRTYNIKMHNFSIKLLKMCYKMYLLFLLL